MIRIGVIKTANKDLYNWPEIWQNNDWKLIERDGIEYLKITSFEKYFTQPVINQLAFFFEESEFEAWLNTSDITPTFLVVEPITNHPDNSDFTRKAIINSMPEMNFRLNRMKLAVDVHTYEGEVERKELFKEYEILVEKGEYNLFIRMLQKEFSIDAVLREIINSHLNDFK